VPTITDAELAKILSGDPEELSVHLQMVEKDIKIDGHKVRVHCHCLTVDANGKIRVKRLVEFMRNTAADYAIPRSKILEAMARDQKYNSTAAVSGLNQEARDTFTDLAKTGEGGEMLLFLLAERFLGLPHVLCKMDLKTDGRLHYHGADGVYADVAEDGHIKLYWGESKMYADANAAIRECVKSLAPFILEDEHKDAARERDIILLSDKADLGDERLSKAFRTFFDKSSPLSNQVQYCGIALVGFDAGFYAEASADKIAEHIMTSARAELKNWKVAIGERLTAEKLEALELHFFCLPLPSVTEFREAFLQAMGKP
jgi:hypothetical protein